MYIINPWKRRIHIIFREHSCHYIQVSIYSLYNLLKCPPHKPGEKHCNIPYNPAPQPSIPHQSAHILCAALPQHILNIYANKSKCSNRGVDFMSLSYTQLKFCHPLGFIINIVITVNTIQIIPQETDRKIRFIEILQNIHKHYKHTHEIP